MSVRAAAVVACAVAVLAWLPSPALAQGFGIGPRLSFVRGDVPSGTPSTRFIGGTVRMRSSKHVGLELALDYRTQVSADGTSRLRERPFQGSLLLFPVRGTFSPYLVVGYGFYSRMTDTLDANGATVSTTSDRKTGAHLGFGAELYLSRHTAFFADYRFRFVRFGSPDPGSAPINIPGSSLIPGLGKVQLSHQGSMWTSGVAFYF